MNRRFDHTHAHGLGGRPRRCRIAGRPDADLLDWGWYQTAVLLDESEPRVYEEEATDGQ